MTKNKPLTHIFVKLNTIEDLTRMSCALEKLPLMIFSYKQKQNYQVWQEGFHPEMILDSEMLLKKLNYIHNNPVKRGYVEEPGHWRYSSWNNYNVSEEMGILPIEIIG